MQTGCASLPRVARNGRPSLRPPPPPALTAGACPRRTQTALQEPVAGGGRGAFVKSLHPEDRDFRTAARDAYQGRAPPPVVVDRAGRIAVTLARGATVGDLRDALQARARARPAPAPRPPRAALPAFQRVRPVPRHAAAERGGGRGRGRQRSPWRARRSCAWRTAATLQKPSTPPRSSTPCPAPPRPAPPPRATARPAGCGARDARGVGGARPQALAERRGNPPVHLVRPLEPFSPRVTGAAQPPTRACVGGGAPSLWVPLASALKARRPGPASRGSPHKVTHKRLPPTRAPRSPAGTARGLGGRLSRPAGRQAGPRARATGLARAPTRAGTASPAPCGAFSWRQGGGGGADVSASPRRGRATRLWPRAGRGRETCSRLRSRGRVQGSDRCRGLPAP